MAAELQIKYNTDSIEGKSLSTILTGEGNGWVEFCNQRGQLFFADAVSKEFYKKYHQQAIDTIIKYIQTADKKRMGFVHHLSTVLLNDEFIFPMFAVVPADKTDVDITAGFTRMIASMINGRTARELKTVVFAPKGQTITQLENVKPLTSTVNFEKIYNLADIDYEISMSDNARGDMSEFCFDRSVLKHSIYDKKDQALPHTQLGANIISYWGKHGRTDKILLNIRCTPEVEKLIQPSKIFDYNVVHENVNEWQWSYGKILGAYRKTEAPVAYDQSQIHLWLYDITEPVYLDLLIPWVTGQYTCCHTKNKKALFFDTSSEVTSMQIIGDWVK
jgi:hypothetical protein